MQEFRYEIITVDEKERWIFLHADMWDIEEPDAFIYLMKKIRDDLKGTIVDRGMSTYQIENDPCRLTYQWDTCFGITIVYPKDVSCKEVLDFLGKYI